MTCAYRCKSEKENGDCKQKYKKRRDDISRIDPEATTKLQR